MTFNKDVHFDNEINCVGKTGLFISDYGLNDDDIIKGFIFNLINLLIILNMRKKFDELFSEIDWDILYFCDNGRKVSSCALPKVAF